MKQNLINKSTPELLQLKASWLRDNEKLLRDLSLAVWATGQHNEQHNRDVATIEYQDLSFSVCREENVFDPKKNKGIVKYWLSVNKGTGRWYQNIQIAYYTFYENAEAYGSADKSFNNFAVPGDWLDAAQSIIKDAEEAETKKYAEEEEKERQWLLEKLLNGIDI